MNKHVKEAIISIKDIEDAEHFNWGNNCHGWFLSNPKALSIIYEKMPLNTKEKKHYHEHTWQFFFITKGEAIININDHDYLIKQNQFVEMPHGVPHQVRNSGNTDLEFLVISVPNRPISDRVEVEE